MSDYVKSTDFASKDTLPSGDSAKIVRGTEIDAEFEALEVAIASKANTSDVSSTYAPLNSPTFTGSPVLPTGTTAVTQAAGDNDTSVATTAFVTTAVAALGYPAFKNRIINGAMMIDQRNAGASVSLVNSGNTFIVDRFFGYAAQTSKLTAQQNAGGLTGTNLPTGFTNYIGATSSATWTAGASENFLLGQLIEGFNFADTRWGTANASTATISFWVRSSLTGTFSGSVSNGAADRSYVFTFTVNSANTWEQKTITIAGDTSGTWVGATNGLGLRLYFDLGCGTSSRTTAGSWTSGFYIGATGANSLGSASGATFYITGVQLEKGSTATSFDYRPYGTELQLCQRYFWKTNASNQQQVGGLNGVFFNTIGVNSWGQFPVTMRAAPTLTRGGSSDTFYVSGVIATATYSSFSSTLSQDGIWAYFVSGTSAAAGYNASYNGQLSFSAEL